MLLLLINSAATAAVTVAQYREAKSNGDYSWENLKIYISGLGAGILTANEMLTVDHRALIYCEPRKLKLGTDNYIVMIDKELAETKPPDNTEINIVLLYALKSTFPCPKAGKSHEH
jgi:hypothetical protein